MRDARRVERAWWEGRNWGRIALANDWSEERLPPIGIIEGKLSLKKEASIEFAKLSGYAVNGDWVSFVCKLNEKNERVYLAGEFNGWVKAIGDKTWELKAQEIDGENYGVLTVRADLLGESRLFKFVAAGGVWREPPPEAPNVAYENGARNHYIDPRRTGAHLLRFEIESPHDWTSVNELLWQDETFEEKIILWPGSGFYQLKSDKPMGAMLEGTNKTRFRIFAPRATKVSVAYFKEKSEKPMSLTLEHDADGSWSGVVPQNLEGYLYTYSIEGPRSAHTSFDANQPVLDPWALAVKEGCAVVVDKQKVLKKAPAPFAAPAYEDLIIAEAHVRDLIEKAPIELTPAEKRGYAGVKKLLESKLVKDPLENLGVTAVEIQPMAEFDVGGETYHWGYMPIAFMAPYSGYASNPAALSQIEETQQMVAAFHNKGMAVIADVVFNHYGVPASPLFIDKAYYFRLNAEGALTNWSGCGNDFRIESAMAQRLCLEAMEWWMKAYGVDGFRFDLGELLGMDFLANAQKRMREINPNVIMICEPWSFRGHLGGSLKPFDYASWNDGFREYMPAYLQGRTDAGGLKYFIGGSVGSLTRKPTQSLNYVESHDDHTWLDKITQNPGKNGFYPTLHDRRLTHLVAATLMMSLGVPMISLGQEALRSKYGVRDTYMRGDLNAYDYARVRDFPGTMEYFRDLIALRKSTQGAALRVDEYKNGYLRFYSEEGGSALGVLYNADYQTHAKRMFYVINPQPRMAKIDLPDLEKEKWTQVADYERVKDEGLKEGAYFWVGNRMELPPVSVAIFVEE